MKALTALTGIFTLALATIANAQAARIQYPSAGARLHEGNPQVIQLVRTIGMMGSQEVGLVLSLRSCPGSPCPPAEQSLGTVLYNGKYTPQTHVGQGSEPYQNFTVTIPSDLIERGKANLIATRFHLIGAGPSPVLETNVVQVTVL